ncbi:MULTISPECIES: GTPase [Citrobacter]|uniref:GTPase n=1 Tax=Citrobacter TaxID=544 RepID=UPI000EF1B149|nr:MULTISPECIES: GTPase [Citrobacter]AYL61520.1 hypothetical protein CUC49_07660 [Citrobacter pasteurii]MDU5628490.1 hypothetical protein [Citrobacter sp.]NHM10248.1 hypothetical protein [Citrobacter youngae]
MSAVIETSGQVYKKISQEVGRILDNLTKPVTDTALKKANDQARLQLESFQTRLNEAIESLSANAEWETFTIAFYGETNAGKSTVIEALRILLKEESKLARQDAFRRYQQQHNLSPEILENSDRLLKDNETRTEALSRALAELRGSYAAREAELEKELSLLSTLIEDQKKHWSAIRRLIALYILSPEQKQQQQLRKRQLALDAEISQATQSLTSQQAECDRERQTILELRARVENQLGELNALADGEIIGTGLSDFTLDATLYPFEAHGQRFALLDIPGIEGKESKVLEQIKRAVEKAHAVFYVTSKATAPQKGDEENPGTLEKIKSHLNAQTEVWTLFNKRVTNAMGLSKPLVDQDEAQSIKDLNEKMREQLGDNYRDTLVVSAMPGFLSVAEHLVPGGSHIKSRDKFLKSFTREQLLEKTGVAELARVLTQQLVTDSKEKITRSNTQKTRIVLDDIAAQVTTLQQDTYAGLASQFSDKKDSAHKQLDLALKSLYQRLIDRADEGISQFRNQAREQVYQAIDGDISTDRFKSELESAISREHGKLEKSLPEALKKELERFQLETSDIIEQFQQHAHEILDTFESLQKHQFSSEFPLTIDIDNGIKVSGLLASLAGGALLFWNPAGWLVLAPALASLAFAAYKAVRSFFSSNYKMSQQKQSTDKNLSNVASHMNDTILEGIEKAFPELKKKIAELKVMLEAPVQQVSSINEILTQAAAALRLLSNEIDFSGAK